MEALIVATSFLASRVNVLSFGEPWPSLPSMRFVRVQFVYQGPGTRIVIYDTSRQRTNRARANEEKCNGCASTEGFPAHIRVLHGLSPAELSTLQRAARSGAGRSRAAVRDQLGIVGADTEARFHRSLNRAALEILSGSD